MRWSIFYSLGLGLVLCAMLPASFGQAYGGGGSAGGGGGGSYYNYPYPTLSPTPSTQAPTAAPTPAPATTAAPTPPPVTTPAPTPPPVTTAAPPTCSAAQFCNSAPTASAYLQGPFQVPGTLLLFNGNCVVEYLFDPSSTTPAVLSGQTAPQTITSYFKQSSFPGPVDLAYLQFADASKTNFNLFLNNRATSTMLSCSTDPAKSTMGATCPGPATPIGAAMPLAVTTSASSQIDQTDSSNPKVVQYVVIGGTEIGLYNSDFTTLYSKTSGFLANTVIKKINAIQILTDTQGFTGTRLIVFGSDANGVNYVAFTAPNFVVQGVPTFLLSSPGFVPNPVFDPNPPALQTAVFKGTLTCPM